MSAIERDGMADDRLWCVNIHGPDDVIATPDYITAVRIANTFNTWWQREKEARPLHPYDPLMWAVPIVWPHSSGSHEPMLEDPNAEYAGFIAAARESQP